MAKQDDWIRITLRIPPELHSKLTDAAAQSSMNAEIISRLEASFSEKSDDHIVINRSEMREMLIEIVRAAETGGLRTPEREENIRKGSEWDANKAARKPIDSSKK